MNPTEAHSFVAGRSPDETRLEIERALAATTDDDGAALERATLVAEMALVARLAPWRAGSVAPNVRKAIAALARGADPDAETGRFAMRLAACYARRGRTDDDAYRLARWARARVQTGGLLPDDRAFATEGANHLERASFVPSLECVRELVGELDAEGVVREARAQLGRRNASFAALLLEAAFERAHPAPRRFGLAPPAAQSIEKALEAFRSSLERGGGRTHAEAAILLARAYVDGSFVDARACEHVKAVLAHLGEKLDPELHARLLGYVEEDAFCVPDARLYEQVKAWAAVQPLDLRLEVAVRTDRGNLVVARRLCELELVRRLDPWYLGEPDANVARAATRAAASLAKLDEHARWVAASLAALYAATLEPAAHARALVGAVLEQEASSPDLRAALEQAGVDPDVPAAELLDVYRAATDPRAQVERFRALANEAALSDAERKAGEESLEWLSAQREGRPDSSGVARARRTLGDLAEVVVPEALASAATTLIEATLRDVAAESARRLGRTRIERELAKAGIASREDAHRADVTVLDRIAWGLTHENRVLAALEGFGCGLGGATLVLLDLPALLSVNLNAIAAIATVYGFDAEDPAEVERALALLAGGPLLASSDLAEAPSIGRVAVRRLPEKLSGRAALALRAIAVRLGGRLAKHKLLQLIPVLGGAVGAGLNYQFTLETTRTASMLYRYRWVRRRALGARARG